MSYYDGEPDPVDKFFDGIRGYFKRVSERKQARRLEKQAVANRAKYAQGIRDAIDKDDLPKLNLFLSFLLPKKDKPSGDQNPQIAFNAAHKVPTDIEAFKKEHGADLVYHALQHGKLDTFAPVYEAIAYTAVVINERWESGQSRNATYYTDGTIPLLYEAIKLHKSDIAAYIAKDPRVDITARRTRTNGTAYDMAKEIMEKGEGMKEVVAILSERIANMKEQEADHLKAQAARLRDEMPKL